MTDKKSSESRRKLLKSIAVGSGAVIAGKSLPENWVKPVVDSVMLPAHAQTSPPTCAFGISMISANPFSLTPPGPDVPAGQFSDVTITVTPAPPDGQIVDLEVFIDGSSSGTVPFPMTNGIVTFGIAILVPGTVELRATYDCAVTSIYYTSIVAPNRNLLNSGDGETFRII